MKKPLFRILKWLIVIGIASFVLIEGLIIYTGNKMTSEEVDYLLVLGAGLNGENPSPALRHRLDVAVDYLSEHQDTLVIVSGGQGRNEVITEAQAMEKYLIHKGVEASRIIKEARATSTFENIKYSIALVDGLEAAKVGVVTNRFHVFRALFIAKRMGMDTVGLPAKIPPSIVFQSYVREYFAFIKSLLLDY